MKSQFSSTKSFLLVLFFFSALFFALGFFLSFQQERKRTNDIGQLSWSHLNYALSLNDDMAVIDWSKDLEALGDVVAYQTKQDGKIVAEGGNRNFLPEITRQGISFQAPSKWIFYKASNNERTIPREMILVYRTVPGPFLWGLNGFLGSLLGGSLAFWFFSMRRGEVKPSHYNAPGISDLFGKTAATSITGMHPGVVEKNKPYLFLDKNFIIQEVTPETGIILGKNPSQLSGRHLFDLSPQPALMSALEKGLEVKIANPFGFLSGLSASLQQDPHGTLLFLERVEETETPQKH